MTAIVGILNTHGVAIAADSATTYISSNNVQKVHNRANKIFTLSKKHSIGIAIYNTASFMDIPWEVVIKMYRKQLQDITFDKVEDCKKNFIEYLNSYLDNITPESKESAFYQYYSGIYNEITNLLNTSFEDNKVQLAASQNKGEDIQNLINEIFVNYSQSINAYEKNTDFTLTFNDFEASYINELLDSISGLQSVIIKILPGYVFTAENILSIKNVYHTLALFKNIHETHSGLVFIGYGEKEVFPSSHLVVLGTVIHKTIRYGLQEPIEIKPIKNEGVILPYAQADVTFSILRGIDPTVENEINSSINKSFEELITALQPKFTDGDEAIKIRAVASTLIDKLNQFNYDTITSPILKMLNCMDKEDMADLAESLVNITSLRRKFSETNESVGGPIDVAVITKGDGFIWTKRKQYFDNEVNKHL